MSASTPLPRRRPAPRRRSRPPWPDPSRGRAPRTRARGCRARGRPRHHDHAADVPRALDQPLADAGQLGLPARVDAVVAGAVLARHLADARVDAERAQRALHDAGDVAEALVRAGPGVLRAAGPGERDRVLVEHGRATAGQPLDRLEAAGPRGMRGVRIAGAREIQLAERDHRRRAARGGTSPAARRAQRARGSRARRRCRRRGGREGSARSG